MTRLLASIFQLSYFLLHTSYFRLFALLTIISLPQHLNAAELEPIALPSADHRLGYASPDLEPIDQTFLMHFVRRVIARQLQDGSEYQTEYAPTALQELKCRVSLTIRDQGHLIASADSDFQPVLEGCRQAAKAAAIAGREKNKLTDNSFRDQRLEIELIGAREQVGDGSNTPVSLSVMFEPGIHGIAARAGDREILVRPSQLISKEVLCQNSEDLDYRCDRYEAAIKELKERLGLSREPPERDPRSIMLLRFQTMHLYEARAGGEAIRLIAGMRYVKPDEVTKDSIADAVRRLNRFIRYRQVSEGIFSYEFLPGRDMYWPQQNWVRQAATMGSLSTHARRLKDAESAEALGRAVAAFEKMTQPVPDVPGAKFVATPDGENPLGATALFALALIDAPDRERHAGLRAALLNGIASLQRKDGSFRTAFPPAADNASQDYFPGEALLAMAEHYELERDARWRELCDRSLPYYKAYFREKRPPMFVPWQSRAWGHLARTTRLRKYADFVYEMSDRIAGTLIDRKQVHLTLSGKGLPPTCIYDGAFDVYESGTGGVSSAVYLEGMVDAVRTAEALGDRQRADRYREMVRKGARFVMQLMFKPDEDYYIRSPRDVIDGMRNTPIHPTLRIDNMQHAMSALMGAMDVLSGEHAVRPSGTASPRGKAGSRHEGS